MKIVERAEVFPGECLFTHSGDGPFIDFERDYTNMHGPGSQMYMKLTYAEEIGKFCGMLPRREAEALKTENEALKAELEAERARYVKLEQATDQLVSAGYQARAKRGRPAKELANAA